MTGDTSKMAQIKNYKMIIVLFLLLYSSGFIAQGSDQQIQPCSNEAKEECYICNVDDSPDNGCSDGYYQVSHSSYISGCDPQPSPTDESPVNITNNSTEISQNQTVTTQLYTTDTTGSATDNETTTTTAQTTQEASNSIVCKPCHHLCKTCDGDGLQNCTECAYREVNGTCAPESDEEDDSVGIGVIVGAVIGGCVFVAVIIVIIVLILRHKRRSKSSENPQPRSLQQLASVEESPTTPPGTEGIYQNLPAKNKAFGEMVQRKQDDITRYRRDPTFKEKTEKENPFYENKGIIEKQSKKVDNDKFMRNDSTELYEIKALGKAPPPPPITDEPSETYENFNTDEARGGSATTEEDELDDYENAPANLYKAPKVIIPENQHTEPLSDPEPNEEYQNISQIRGSGNLNQGFVDSDLEPYGNEEAIQQWRKSGDNPTNPADDHVYGNILFPRT